MEKNLQTKVESYVPLDKMNLFPSVFGSDAVRLDSVLSQNQTNQFQYQTQKVYGFTLLIFVLFFFLFPSSIYQLSLEIPLKGRLLILFIFVSFLCNIL